ncbi:ATP-binding protein [Streptomonospora salina]|uniref:Anti-sigma regulatory factor (Ser/Thr protein kinase) n=1 Tax=Streptomonospora salina TaxID=104205 RepID=A0A841E9S3_9ACTN|nr:ATP-binding protein [Streptomonospora salina]MBB5999742.1 anti-sigma regulatory factor (Ser/Thr protein kinase) [Streptomonospora salina]
MTPGNHTRTRTRTGTRTSARTHTRTFPGVASGVADSRHWLADLLRTATAPPVPEPVVDTAALLLSEAASNAVRHTASGSRPGGRFTVHLHTGADALTVDVEDDGAAATVPTLAAPGDDAESGRGLVLVDTFADAWGVPSRGGGLYFTLTRNDSPTVVQP